MRTRRNEIAPFRPCRNIPEGLEIKLVICTELSRLAFSPGQEKAVPPGQPSQLQGKWRQRISKDSNCGSQSL